jgi:hypothetical protein
MGLCTWNNVGAVGKQRILRHSQEARNIAGEGNTIQLFRSVVAPSVPAGLRHHENKDTRPDEVDFCTTHSNTVEILPAWRLRFVNSLVGLPSFAVPLPTLSLRFFLPTLRPPPPPFLGPWALTASNPRAQFCSGCQLVPLG